MKEKPRIGRLNPTVIRESFSRQKSASRKSSAKVVVESYVGVQGVHYSCVSLVLFYGFSYFVSEMQIYIMFQFL